MRRWKPGIVWTGTMEEILSNDRDELAKGMGKLERPDLPVPVDPPPRYRIRSVDRVRGIIHIVVEEA